MWRSLENIYRLGMKELISLRRDPVLLIFVFYALTLQIVIAGEGLSFQVRNASTPSASRLARFLRSRERPAERDSR